MGARIDKFLWSVRIYKTRTQATDACKAGKVTIDGRPVKPAKEVDEGDIINVKKDHINRSYRVISPIQKRVGAKLVTNFVEDITPESELNKLEMMKQNFEYRDRGLGRPTKRDRRIITKIKKGF
jgi:ribosome-associated heat shock protein Hsp15